MRKKPVGSAEQAVLGWLAANRGQWTVSDGSIWESMFWTLELLGSLSAKGLVTEVVAGAHYTLNEPAGVIRQ